MTDPKFKVHAVDTRYGRKWRVVFPDGFAVRFLTWSKAMDYTQAQIQWMATYRGLHNRGWLVVGPNRRPPRSETTLK
jgi:hypothetical protein